MSDGEISRNRLEDITLSDDDDDDDEEGDFDFDDVVPEEILNTHDELEPEADEDLDTVLKALSEKKKAQDEQQHLDNLAKTTREERPQVTKKPEVIDDFIRNFLIKSGMNKTLEAFQNEWYEFQQQGKLTASAVVPDIYLHNQYLEDTVRRLKNDVQKHQEIATKAKSTWDKLKKERDHHRMHHQRVVQEKNKLITDIKRLKKHTERYEPALREMTQKYERSVSEKTLAKIERDKLLSKVTALEQQIKEMEETTTNTKKPSKDAESTSTSLKQTSKKHPKDSQLPPDDRPNPYLGTTLPKADTRHFKLTETFKGHAMTVSSIAIHPKKPKIIATASDDSTWAMWQIPGNKLIMSADGHDDWLACCDFHPRGTHLATSSGDGTVKIWDFLNSQCSATLSDHTGAVWACDFHYTGDFLASASLDHTARLWDFNSMRCRQTLRAHVDSVNSVKFQPFSNNLCTGSGDKTVSLWDPRTGLCVQTFYGHDNAVNHVNFNSKGDVIASCDSDGVIKLWDIRMISQRAQINAGPQPVNKTSFDQSGEVLAAACDDSTIKIFNIEDMEIINTLRGHEGEVQTVVFDPSNSYLLSGGSDCTIRVWS